MAGFNQLLNKYAQDDTAQMGEDQGPAYQQASLPQPLAAPQQQALSSMGSSPNQLDDEQQMLADSLKNSPMGVKTSNDPNADAAFAGQGANSTVSGQPGQASGSNLEGLLSKFAGGMSKGMQNSPEAQQQKEQKMQTFSAPSIDPNGYKALLAKYTGK
jgi:hypothetical protein